MPLSCYCEYEPDSGDVLYDPPRDYKTCDRKRATKCSSCREPVRPGDLAVEFTRYKVPEHEIELRIYGETAESGPPRASLWLCERCGDLYWSLADLGFCVGPYEDLRETVRDYAAEFGPASKARAAA